MDHAGRTMGGPAAGLPPADLVVIGGLTVDTFADGTATAGGAALHATQAAAAIGLRVGVVTQAGPEREARDGVAALSRLASVRAGEVEASIAFEHGSSGGSRTLRLRDRGSSLPLPLPATGESPVLYAPVAAELRAGHLSVPRQEAVAGAVLQGWLRSLSPGRPVEALPLLALDATLVAHLARLDLVCCSVEDLAAEASGSSAHPEGLLAALRARLGGRPVVALTNGAEGAWIDDGARIRQVRPPRVVDGIDTTGAGDAFAALMLAALASGEDAVRAAEIAADETARFLRRRRVRRVAIGDVHGHRERLVALLGGNGLLDAEGHWSGANAELWLLGDLTDRGPDGIGVMDLLHRLEGEAAQAGGRVESLLGNHELLLLAAHVMRGHAPGPGAAFRSDWLANGGRPHDLAGLTPELVAWLRARPAMALVDGDLLVHADSAAYASMGGSVDEVNSAVRDVLAGTNPRAWDRLLDRISARMAFSDPRALHRFLEHFGAARVVHGHTPVPLLVDGDPELSARPLRYASGRAIAADPGLYLGGPGFVVEL